MTESQFSKYVPWNLMNSFLYRKCLRVHQNAETHIQRLSFVKWRRSKNRRHRRSITDIIKNVIYFIKNQTKNVWCTVHALNQMSPTWFATIVNRIASYDTTPKRKEKHLESVTRTTQRPVVTLRRSNNKEEALENLIPSTQSRGSIDRSPWNFLNLIVKFNIFTL